MRPNGFTLIELLVAVAVFSIIVGASTVIFVSAVQSQRRALAYQQLLDNTSYVMEYMSRALRMAKKDDIEIGGVTMDCFPLEEKVNYKLIDRDFGREGEEGIKFRNYQNGCQEFYFEGGQLKEEKEGVVLPLTPDNLEITALNFNLIGESQGDILQPRVTIFLDIGLKGSGIPSTKIQTTVSQRDLDVEY